MLLAIAVFVSGGIAARSLWSAAQKTPAPTGTPARDVVVVPSPEGAAIRPPADTRPSRTAHPSSTTRRSPRPKTTPRPTSRTHRATPRATRSTIAAPTTKSAAAETAVARLTNAQRAAHGCSALRVDTRLRSAARLHSVDMRDRNYFDHNSPDGRTPWDRFKAAGYPSLGAENIAKGYPTAQAVVQGWMNSPGHRANILNCSLKAVGIGVEYGAGGPWWTQDFGFQ